MPTVPLRSHQASVLTNELGYTEEEVSRMDSDMADLAFQRRLRRPASGMPPDWAVRTSESPVSAEDDRSSGVPGALDLDEILGYEDPPMPFDDRRGQSVAGMRQDLPRPATRRGNYRREGEGGDDYYASATARRQPMYYDEPDEDGYYEVRSSREDEPVGLGRRVGDRGAEGRDRRRRRRGLDPAEKYERKLRGWDVGEERSIWTGVGDEGPWPT